MPTITKQDQIRPARKTDRAIGTNKAVSWLGDVMAAVAGTESGEDSLSVLNRKLEGSNIVGSGTTTPVPDANSPFIWINTIENQVRIKQTTGSGPTATYSWSEPIAFGDYQARIILSAADNPATPTITWNALNETFNIRGGDWAVDTPNAKWWRLVLLPALSNTEVLSELVRIGDPAAADISYSPPGTGQIPPSVTNVNEALNHLDTRMSPASASWIQVGSFTDETYSEDPPVLGAPTTTASRTVTIQSNLTAYSSNFNQPLFLEAHARITTGRATSDLMSFRFEALSSSGNPLRTRILGTGSIQAGLQAVSDTIRISGNLPPNTSSIILRVTVTGNSGGVPSGTSVAGIDFFRVEIRPDLDADEIIISPDDVGNNIKTENLNNLKDVVGQLDELPIQYSDFGTADDTTVIAGSNYTFSMPVPQLIQDINDNEANTYRLRIDYKTLPAVGSGEGSGRRNNSAWTFKLLQDNTATDLLSPAVNFDEDGTAGQNSHFHIITVPNDVSNIRGQFAVADADDADLGVTDIQYSYQERAKAIDISVDSANFDGNLATTDDTVQKVAQKFDDLSISGGSGADDQTASEVSISRATFSDPASFPGGIRDAQITGATVPGVTNTPTNVQQALNNIDLLLTRNNNPYQATQVLDRPDGPGISNAFPVDGSNTHRLSNPVDLHEILSGLGTDLQVTVRGRVSAISSNFTGDIRLRNSDNSANLPGTASDVQNITGTEFDAGDHFEFVRTISTPVPNTFRVRISRTIGSCTLDRIVVYISEASTGQAGGQSTAEPEIIWQSGATTNDRTTITSTTVNYTLANNRRFSDFSSITIWYDSDGSMGSGLFANVPELAVSDMITNHGTGARAGLIVLEAFNAYKLIKPVTQTTFRIYEGSSNVGIRAIYGNP